MSQQFYLVATLPLLSFDQDQAQPAGEFLELCRAHLSPEEVALVEGATLVPVRAPFEPALEFETLLDGRAVLSSWHMWESRLRDELVRLRAQKLEVDGARFLTEAPYVTGVYEAAREAMGSASPLEAEELLDRARWRYLDELEAGHFFDIARLIIYHLRLQILERRSLFNREHGEKRFDELYTAVMPASFSEEFGETNLGSEQ